MANLPKSITLSKKIQPGQPYIDSEKMIAIKDDMETQLKKIKKYTDNIYKLLDKADNTNKVKGKTKEKVTNTKTKLKKRSDKAEEYRKSLHDKFNKDVVVYVAAVNSK